MQRYERFIIREYLQYKILEIVFESSCAIKLTFLGGTCLRIVHNSSRFSEDLDFDNFSLSSEDVNGITEIIKLKLEKLEYEVKIRMVKDVRPFLFDAKDDKKVLLFAQCIQQVKLQR